MRIRIGDASNGLCGGMAFAARDYFEAGRKPSQGTTPPRRGRLFDFLVDRLLASFELPTGPARYLELMSPALPDGEPVWRWLGVGPHGRSWRMIREEWPKVRAEIDAGHPSPLGLVLAKSSNPIDLKLNHQVLAYGYDLVGEALSLRLYDPNLPARDDVSMSMSVAEPRKPTAATLRPQGTRVHSFFRVGYTPSPPP